MQSKDGKKYQIVNQMHGLLIVSMPRTALGKAGESTLAKRLLFDVVNLLKVGEH